MVSLARCVCFMMIPVICVGIVDICMDGWYIDPMMGIHLHGMESICYIALRCIPCFAYRWMRDI